MDPHRIAELLVPFLGPGLLRPGLLSPGQVCSISTYIDLLLRWNARINLTSVRQPEDIVTRHFGESLFAARHLFPAPVGKGFQPGEAAPGSAEQSLPKVRVIDVGSGAGFPGLPVRIWAPHVHLTLIESNQKKATFLREVIRSLKLTDADVFAGRAEDFVKGDQGRAEAKADIVTLRAVEHFDSILPTAAQLMASPGRLAVLISKAQLKRVYELVPDLKWIEPVKLPRSEARVLIIGRKESS
jgi:16S rRNA (guanine527-N7)-methyltransferase